MTPSTVIAAIAGEIRSIPNYVVQSVPIQLSVIKKIVDKTVDFYREIFKKIKSYIHSKSPHT